MRFRNYLGEQYRKEDRVNGRKTILPITTIYILGFALPGLDAACVKVERQYIDLVDHRPIEVRNDFIESLTHDSFVVQVPKIKERFQSRLETLLSLFAQLHFVDEYGLLKSFPHEPEEEEMKEITRILEHTAGDAAERKVIEEEEEAWRTFYNFYDQESAPLRQELKAKDEEIARLRAALESKSGPAHQGDPQLNG